MFYVSRAEDWAFYMAAFPCSYSLCCCPTCMIKSGIFCCTIIVLDCVPERHPGRPDDQYTTLIAEGYYQGLRLTFATSCIIYSVWIYVHWCACICLYLLLCVHKENMGGEGIQVDVLHITVFNSRQTKCKLVRQQKGSFPLNIICQRPNPLQLRTTTTT